MKYMLLLLLLVLSSFSYADENIEKMRLASQIVAGMPVSTPTTFLSPDTELQKKLQAIDDQMIDTLAKSFTNQFPKLTLGEVSATVKKHLASTFTESMRPMLRTVEESTKRKIAAYAEAFSIEELKEILRKPTALNEKHETFFRQVIETNMSLEKMAMQSFANRYVNSFETISRDLATQSSEKPSQ